ncbi:MAG: hypothetical protein HC897_06655, partial [Thermoanaerobaculia bacterium]|nr:hypothetical protein [Thermoanaerobaculia bacterium]
TSPPTVLDAQRAPNDLVLFRNSDPTTVAGASFSSTVNEPSAVRVGRVAFYTANWYAARSTDGGATWALVNPFSGPFAAPAGQSFCCDQAVAQDPSTQTLFYLQQYSPSSTTGTHRINVDQGANGTFDCFYDITPQLVGFPSGRWFDFPDLVVSSGFLYHTSNTFTTPGGSFAGGYVGRYPLSQLSTCTPLTIDAFVDTGDGAFRLTRGATDTMYFGTLETLTSMRIWTWPAASPTPTSVDRTVTAWLNNTRNCAGPGGVNWCGFIDFRPQGAWVADGVVGFMWVPSENPGGGFPFPYTQVARFNEVGLTFIDGPQIWASDRAMVYPSVAVNGNGDLGGTIMWGGGTFNPSCSVWVADDVNGDTLAPLESLASILGTSGPSSARSGDYLFTNVNAPNDKIWAGSCFAYNSTSRGTSRFALFGREGNGDLFNNGFESGNVSAWTAAFP